MKDGRIKIFLEKEQTRQIAQIARQEGKSISQVVRELLDLGLKERHKRQMKLAAQILLEDYRRDAELTAFTALDGEA